MVAQVREAVGDGVDIMLDANMSYDRRGALVLAGELEQLGVAWLEEPILSRSLTQYVDDHTWLADRVSIRLAGGESLLTRFEYLDLLNRRTFDVLQPDCTSVGGISEAKRVADMASAWNIDCVPHIACSSGTGVALAAGLHLILACENAPLIEVDAYGGPGWDGMLVDPLQVKDGYVEASDAPGLGVELGADAFERFAVVSMTVRAHATTDVLERLGEIGVIPVAVVEDAAVASSLGDALKDGGLPCVEVTLRTASALSTLGVLAEDPDLLVGAGTVTSPDQVDRVVAVGARFVVSPGFSPSVVKACRGSACPFCLAWRPPPRS